MQFHVVNNGSQFNLDMPRPVALLAKNKLAAVQQIVGSSIGMIEQLNVGHSLYGNHITGIEIVDDERFTEGFRRMTVSIEPPIPVRFQNLAEDSLTSAVRNLMTN